MVQIPIDVPPGRQGLQPALAFSYSSRNGNGPLGVGWHISGLSLITTCRQSPAIDGAYGGQYPDRLCLDGQRLVPAILALDGQPLAPASGAQYRTEINPYSKIVAHGPTDYPDWFEVYTSDGMILRYASRPNSHAKLEGHVSSCTWGSNSPGVGLTDIGPPSWYDVHGGCVAGALQRRAWMLDEVADRFGNRMEIDYDASEPLLPIEIRYTYHLTPISVNSYNLPNTKTIVFEYEPRPDVRVFSLDGIDYGSRKRLKTIRVIGPLQLSHANYAQQSGVLRQYALTYAPNPVTSQSTLTQIVECAGNQAAAPCKAPLVFAYSGSGMLAMAKKIEFEDKSFSFKPANNLTGLQTFGLDGFRVADVNGDGFDDLLYRNSQQFVLAPRWYYRLSDGQQFAAEQPTNIPAIPDTADFGVGLVDLDRNETVDAVIPSEINSFGTLAYSIGQGNQNGILQFSPLPPSVYKLPVEPVPSSSDKIVAIADLNGDGLPDLALRFGSPGNLRRWGVAVNQSDASGIRFSDPFDFITSGSACTPAGGPNSVQPLTNCPNAYGDHDPAFVVDIDGDGLDELIVPRQQRETDPGCARGAARCDVDRVDGYALELSALSFASGPSLKERRTGLSSKQVPRVFLDVNGDGLADTVYLDQTVHDANPQLWVAMNKGGSYDKPRMVPVSAAAKNAFSQPNEIRIGDFNNDGLEDIYLVSAGILLLSNGWLGFTETSLNLPLGDDSCQAPNCPPFARRQWDQTLDFNGDGLIDFVQVRGANTHILQRTGPAPALLQQIRANFARFESGGFPKLCQ